MGPIHSRINITYTGDMLKALYFPPGQPVQQPGPIERFLPPLEHGALDRILSHKEDSLGWIFDPFGSSTQLAREVAHAGGVLLIASNNPVTRFLIRQKLSPLSERVLQAALAHFATVPKDGSRLEPFLLDLYRTTCSRCGTMVSADQFIWDKDSDSPSLKAYRCHNCGQNATERTTEVDQGRARAYPQSGLYYARALEELAPAGDPYRKHAESALQVYPGRALYGLVTLLGKLDQFEVGSELRTAARALLLYAFDACNALWDHPEGRVTPRRLSLSTQYKERNVWRAMESAVKAWSSTESDIPVYQWPLEQMPESGTVVIYPGSARRLIESFPPEVQPSLVTVLPRPNHAYWTLAALWSSWLWGRESAKLIKVALHRRRYDWTWHARALRNVMASSLPVLSRDRSILTILTEVEPGFLAAALAGLNEAGLKLVGRALRDAQRHALFEWVIDEPPQAAGHSLNLYSQMKQSVSEILRERGEPTSYDVLHAAALTDLAHQQVLGDLWQSAAGSPRTYFGSILEEVLFSRDSFDHLSRGTEAEYGHYWFTKPVDAQQALSDRVEILILQSLRESQYTYKELLDKIYRAFSGLMSPDRHLVDVCLESYAESIDESGVWALRDEDLSQARDQDCSEISNLLVKLGEQLGFSVESGKLISWIGNGGKAEFIFQVQETATLEAIHQFTDPDLTIVLPGARSTIVLTKARRDMRISEWLERGPQILKFRHVRRLAAESTLQPDNFIARLAIDPPDQHDPQLPLL